MKNYSNTGLNSRIKVRAPKAEVLQATPSHFSTTHYLGESVGPIIGGVAAHSFGYENGYAFFGMLILIYFNI